MQLSHRRSSCSFKMVLRVEFLMSYLPLSSLSFCNGFDSIPTVLVGGVSFLILLVDAWLALCFLRLFIQDSRSNKIPQTF